MAKLSIYTNYTTQWHGKRGVQLALDLGKSKRHKIARFVMNKVKELPVTVKLSRLSASVSPSVFPCMHDGVRKVAMTYLGFFLLLNWEDVKYDICPQTPIMTML